MRVNAEGLRALTLLPLRYWSLTAAVAAAANAIWDAQAASGAGDLRWNFDNYFLVSKDGETVTALGGDVPSRFEAKINAALVGLDHVDL